MLCRGGLLLLGVTSVSAGPYFDSVNGASPTAYWRLDDTLGSVAIVDETGAHDGSLVVGSDSTAALKSTGILQGDGSALLLNNNKQQGSHVEVRTNI